MSRSSGHGLPHGARGLAIAAALLLACAGCGGGGGNDGHGQTALGSAKPLPVEVGRNVGRVPGLSPGDVAAAALLSAYGDGRPPAGWVLVPTSSWQNAVLASQFAAPPVSAGIVPIKPGFLPSGPADVLARVRSTGFPKAHGLRAVVLGHAATDVFVDLQDLGLKLTQLQDPRPASLAAKLVPFRGGWARSYSANVVVVSSRESARDYALPAAAWSAYSGDTVAFVDDHGVPAATARLLVQRQKLTLDKPTMYVVGPRSVISDAVLAKLRAFGPVRRIPGNDAAEAAVALARYKDKATGFGWGLRKGPASVSLVNPADWGNAVAAFAYAGAGPHAPVLLTTAKGTLPRAAARYLAQVRADAPGQGFVFGDPDSVPSQTLARLDALLDPATTR